MQFFEREDPGRKTSNLLLYLYIGHLPGFAYSLGFHFDYNCLAFRIGRLTFHTLQRHLLTIECFCATLDIVWPISYGHIDIIYRELLFVICSLLVNFQSVGHTEMRTRSQSTKIAADILRVLPGDGIFKHTKVVKRNISNSAHSKTTKDKNVDDIKIEDATTKVTTVIQEHVIACLRENVPNATETYKTKPMMLIVPATTISDDILEQASKHLVSIDKRFEDIMTRIPCTMFSPAALETPFDPFESLGSSIISQQVSGAAARSIKKKFIALFNEEEDSKRFPTPAEVLTLSKPILQSAGLSGRKAEYDFLSWISLTKILIPICVDTSMI